MSKYYLFYKKNQEKFEHLSKFQFIEIVKKYSDYHEWYYWTEGLQNWKLISQSPEVFEWLSFQWTENQTMPKLPAPFEGVSFTAAPSKAKALPENVVEFSEGSENTAPPEAQVLSFTGQVVEFQDSIKEKYINDKNFKILNENPDSANNDNFEKTHTAIATDSDRFEKTLTSIETPSEVPENTQTATNYSYDRLESTQTLSNISPGNFDKTAKTTIEPSSNNNNPAPSVSFKEVPKSANDSVFNNTQESTLNQKALDKKHNRRYPRINGRLRTIITNKAKAFMTYTKDISLGGIQTENSIPKDIINSEIEVYISDPAGKKSILFRCHPVGDLNNPNRFSFAKADEKNLQKLGQWLEDLEKSQVA